MPGARRRWPSCWPGAGRADRLSVGGALCGRLCRDRRRVPVDVVAACVIGGIAIAGNRGLFWGALLGAIFLGVIKNALPVVGISPFWQMAISAARSSWPSPSTSPRRAVAAGASSSKSAEVRASIAILLLHPLRRPPRPRPRRGGAPFPTGCAAPPPALCASPGGAADRGGDRSIHRQLPRLALFPGPLEPVGRHLQLHRKGADRVCHGDVPDHRRDRPVGRRPSSRWPRPRWACHVAGLGAPELVTVGPPPVWARAVNGVWWRGWACRRSS